MAKDKDRSVNPAAAARKAEKAKAIKKGKAAVAVQRTERLAKTNPSRIERQIADLHSRQASEGSLPARDRRQLADLERDLERIQKARKEYGGGRPGGDLGPRGTKRGRDGGDRGGHGAGSAARRHQESESSDTDESVRNIPMPRDTPPPIPVRRRGRGNRPPMDSGEAPEGHPAVAAPQQPAAEAKTVYEAKPVIRDLRKEAAGFVPNVVKKKIVESKGQGGRLLEAEEMEALEAQGYGVQAATNRLSGSKDDGSSEQTGRPPKQVEMEEVPDEAL